MEEYKNSLLEQFMYIQGLLAHYYHHNHMAHGPMGNPHRGQGRVLKLLKMQPEISQKDLSDIMDMRPQSLGELLGKLERSGYITRTPSENDKRAMIIRLTEKGREESSRDEEQTDLDALFNCLSEDEKANLSEYLRRIIDKLESFFTEDGGRPGRKWHHGSGRGFGLGHHRHGGLFSKRR